jgi:hypothetical protein
LSTCTSRCARAPLPRARLVHADAADGEGWLLRDALCEALRGLSIRHQITVWDEAEVDVEDILVSNL